ncbi:MAG: SsrA-binding protein [Parcubacteria group bacterium Athens1014_10]|nr:MAG: SsrA-binding protein [Parcubacteria group bacterium Athens1014_10]
MPILAENKRAYFDYEILKKYEAGLVLSGPEVKSAKMSGINLQGSYVELIGREAWLIKCHIAPYPPAFTAQKNYNPLKNKKLLLHKREIASLIGSLQQKGLTALPLKVYTKNGLIKIEIGLAKGRKKWNKKEFIKKRDLDKKIKQKMKQF